MGLCIGDDCTPPETGCRDGFHCSIFYGNLTCVPVGPAAVGESCEEQWCEVGSACVSSALDLSCSELCQSTPDCDTDGTRCVLRWMPEVDWGVCEPGCDPVLQTGCDETEGCYYEDTETGSTLCWEAGSLEAGADCSSLADMCSPGLDCVPEPGTSPFEYYCRAYCDDEHPCESGTCEPVILPETTFMPGSRFCMP